MQCRKAMVEHATHTHTHRRDNKKTKAERKKTKQKKKKTEAIRREIFCCAHVLSVKYDMTNTAQSKDNAVHEAVVAGFYCGCFVLQSGRVQVQSVRRGRGCGWGWKNKAKDSCSRRGPFAHLAIVFFHRRNLKLKLYRAYKALKFPQQWQRQNAIVCLSGQSVSQSVSHLWHFIINQLEYANENQIK